MKWSVEPPSGYDQRILKPRYKVAGNIILIIGVSIIFFGSYGQHYLSEYLVSTGANSEAARYIEFLVIRIFPLVCVAIGGFLLFKAKERPLQPSDKNIEDGKF